MRIAEEAAKKGESNIIMNVLKQVEQENGFETEMAASEMVDDDNLLDGFMEGFNEDKEDGALAEEENGALAEEENGALAEEEDEETEDKVNDDKVSSFKLATTVAVVSLAAAWLGGYLAKS